MKIIVLAKEVPDTYGERKLNLETGLAERAASERVLDEIGERALEVAMTYADTDPDAEIVVMSMAPEMASATIRKGLAMGATSGVHIVDEALAGADLGLTAEVLAAAIKQSGYDLVITGNLSTDGSGGVLPSMVAELLGVPQLTALTSVEIEAAAVSGVRATDAGTMTLSAPLPALISITEQMPDARLPSFKGIMAAKKKVVQTLTLADLSVNADDHDAARSIMIAISERPAREAGIKIVDEGDAGTKIADFLVQNRLT